MDCFHTRGRAVWLGLLLALMSAPGCGDPDEEMMTDGEGTTAGPGETADSEPTATDGGTGEPGGACEGLHDPGPAPLRRLTHTQYNNTVDDLFPGADIPPQTILVDPKSGGFENDGELQNPSALLIEQYQKAAVAVTDAALDGIGVWLPCAPDGGANPTQCGHDFLVDFGARAFRRPLTDDERAAFLGFFDERLAADNFNVALQLAMQAFLQAPPFLYFLEFNGAPVDGQSDIVLLDDYEIAARLSYFLWDTTPDAALLAAAAAGELTTEAGLEQQARRLLGEAPARRAVVNFHRQWLDFEKTELSSLDEATYPAWDPETTNHALLEELRRFIEHTIFDGEGTLAALLTSSESFADATVAEIYGVPAPAEPWGPVSLDPSQRAGVLTTPGWLSGHAHAVNPSPVQRGVFVMERLLCQVAPPPPADVDTNPPDGGAEDPKTNRERYDQHTQDATCASCHKIIDGIGFGFEHYDSAGRYRELDNGFPVDASGELIGTDVDGPFVDGIELAQRLGQSEVVRSCVVSQYFRYALGRAPEISDGCTQAALQAEFETTGGDIHELLVSVVLSDAFRYRRMGGE